MLTRLIGPLKTVADVIVAMQTLDATLPATDGLRWFNFLYLKVTEAVEADTTGWQDRPFLQRFNVIFAQLYFDAIINWEQNRSLTPHAWRPLLRARRDVRLARIQFAFAGMNAHINRDLAVALSQIAERDSHFPSREHPRHADFRRVNDILAGVEASLRGLLATGLIGDLDQAFGELDTILLMWNVRKAREAAWTNGEVLWHLQPAPLLQRDYLARLDQLTAFAGRGLLLPVLHQARGSAPPTPG